MSKSVTTSKQKADFIKRFSKVIAHILFIESYWVKNRACSVQKDISIQFLLQARKKGDK